MNFRCRDLSSRYCNLKRYSINGFLAATFHNSPLRAAGKPNAIDSGVFWKYTHVLRTSFTIPLEI